MNCAHGSLLLVTPTMPGGWQYSCETFCDSRKTIIQSTRSLCIGNRRSSWGQKVFFLMALDQSHMSTASNSWKTIVEPNDSVVNEKNRKRPSSRNLKFLRPWVTLRTRVYIWNQGRFTASRILNFWPEKNSKSPGSSLQSCQRGHDSQSIQRDRYRAHHTGEVMDLMSSSAFRKFTTQRLRENQNRNS